MKCNHIYVFYYTRYISPRSKVGILALLNFRALKFWQRCWWIFGYSGMLRRAVW